jgi:hypothetical protein
MHDLVLNKLKNCGKMVYIASDPSAVNDVGKRMSVELPENVYDAWLSISLPCTWKDVMFTMLVETKFLIRFPKSH